MQQIEMAGTWTRRAVAVLVALLVATLFVQVRPAAASHYTNTTELGGTSNVAAAVSWSKAAFATVATEVLLGRDDLFADSLASGAMQGSRPLLLTNSQTLSPETNTELTRLRPTVVNIMGGPSAVSTAVEEDLKSKGYTVRRFSGPTRLETAIDIARRALPAATTAIVAAAFGPEGGDPTRAFADSIAAGGWAADRVMPVLLTETGHLSVATKNYLRGAAIRTVFVVGGTSAVSEAAVAELRQIGMTVRRVSGATRFDTAVRIAQERGAADASKVAEVILTEGQAADSWAAGFAAAAYSAAKDAPIVLSNGATLPAPTATFLSPTAGAAATKLVCAPRVDGAACDAASEAMGHTAITGTLPRLLAVTVGTTTAGVTDVRFTFTEPVAAAVTADNFKLWSYDNLAAAPTSAARDAARQDVVVAKFPQATVAQSTRAAVAHNAVRGLTSNVSNGEGSVALNAVTPVSTRGPNLVDIIGESTSGTSWEVDFHFDKAVTACGANNKYKLVAVDAEPAETSVPTLVGRGGDAELVGTRVCRASFDASDDVASFTEVARGFVEPGTVTASAGGYPNPPGAEPVQGQTTDAPDLTGVARVAGSTTQMRFTFDQAIDTAVNVNQTAAGFKVYDSRGRVYVGTSAAPDATQGAVITAVLVTFDSGELRNVIMGGSVDAQAVKGAAEQDLSNLGDFNGPDEEAMSPGQYAAGRTAVPALTAVTRSTAGSGSTASVTIRYTFNGTVDRGAGAFAVYAEDGTRTALTSCSVNATAGSDDVDCTVNAGSAAEYNAARTASYAGAAMDAVRPAGQAGDPVASSSVGPEYGAVIA